MTVSNFFFFFVGIISWKGASLFNVGLVFQLGGGGKGMGHWLGWGVFGKNNRMGGIPLLRGQLSLFSSGL